MRKDFFRKGMVFGILMLLVGINIVSAGVGEKTNQCSIENSIRSTLENSVRNLWFVDGDGGKDFTRIQDAIDSDNVSDGDTIYVYKGTYRENIIIDKPIELVGEDKVETVIDANQSGYGIFIETSRVRIRGIKITNSGRLFSGIKINRESGGAVSYIDIIDCFITHHGIGIELNHNDTSIVVISHCKITNNYGKGIDSDDADIERISFCNISDNTGTGIHLRDSAFTLVTENVISGNDGTGICIEGTSFTTCGVLFFEKNHIAENAGPGIALWGGVFVVFVNQNNFVKNNAESYQLEANLDNWAPLIWFNGNYFDPYTYGISVKIKSIRMLRFRDKDPSFKLLSIPDVDDP